jgi:hypothetical protein
MANYYTHITFTVPLENEEQFMFLHDLVELATTLADWDEYKQSQVLAQSPEYQYFVDSPAGDIYVEKQKDADGASYAWLYCEEASDPWTFGLICQAFLSKFKPDGAIAFFMGRHVRQTPNRHTTRRRHLRHRNRDARREHL